MTNLFNNPWQPRTPPLANDRERQAAGRRATSETDLENEWLGWDAWVCAEGLGEIRNRINDAA